MIDLTFDKRKTWGLTVNNLHNGKGFTLYLGQIFVWHQAWFGKHNQSAWWAGKFSILFPFLNKKYSPKEGWLKIRKY